MACDKDPSPKPSPTRPTSFNRMEPQPRPTSYQNLAHSSPSQNQSDSSLHSNPILPPPKIASPSPVPGCRAGPYPVKDDSAFLLNQNQAPPSINSYGINLSFLDLVGSSTPPKLPSPHPLSSDTTVSPSTGSQETFVQDTQERQKDSFSENFSLSPEVTKNDSTPIKDIPIQALTPNGTVRILPHTPSPSSTYNRRRSLRMLNSEEASDTAARIKKAAKIKTLEAKPTKKQHASGDPPLGSTHVPVWEISDEELALISTATGYMLDENVAKRLNGGRTWDVGAGSA